MSVPQSARARTVGITENFSNQRPNGATILPQRIGIIAQGNTAETYPTDKITVTSATQVGQLCGYGSPAHLIAEQLIPVTGDGVGSIPVDLFPLEDAGGAVAATGDITPSGTATAAGVLQVLVNNIASESVVVAVGDTVADLTAAITAAINGVASVPVIATDNTTDVGITAKWSGPTGNDIKLEVVGEVAGLTFAAADPSGGATNPDVDPALAQVGGIWNTIFVSGLDIADTTTLDKYASWNEGRWNVLVGKPAVFFTGNTAATVAAATAVSSTRGTDRTNAQLVSPGSNDLPSVVAARQVARIAVLANENPPHDYGGRLATGLVPGADGSQWDYTQRDQAVKAGSSTVQIRNGVVAIDDVVTFYNPNADPDPAYRFVVDLFKVFNVIYSLDLTFEQDPSWNGAPLIPDGQPTSNPAAKQPNMARTAVAAMIDGLALQAIVADPVAAKASIRAQISESNPKRLDISFTASIAGNTNIISVDFNWGFFYGQLVTVA